MKCNECEYGEYLKASDAYTCNHPKCQDVPIFTGKTHPRCCPLTNPNGTYNGCGGDYRPSRGFYG